MAGWPAYRPAVAAVVLMSLLSGAPVSSSMAAPWIGAGDPVVRSDLQLLADTGVLPVPTLSWPVPWAGIVGVLDALQDRPLSDAQRAAAERLRSRARQELRLNEIGVSAEVAAAVDPLQIRTFDDTPRESGSATLAADWLGERLSARAELTVVADPADGQTVRPDGSYVAVTLGNWVVSAGYLERWWGPGLDGSLILSTNARPAPAIAVDRLDPKPFDAPVLRWLGPWRFSTFMGQLEADRDYSHTLLFGMRAEIRPHPTLQLGASRTAQWCGSGRPCGLDTFWDLLVGKDNGADLSRQPGNQLAGFDARWSWPAGRVPLAVYGQAIGEDEAGFMPSKYLGLIGAEVWGANAAGQWRAHVEYADTACDFVNSNPEFGCAYGHTIYSTGYRYRGRPLGHAMDADGRSLGLGVLWVTAGGSRWELLARDMDLNRAGAAAGHTLAAAPVDCRDLALTHERSLPWGKLTVSVGYTDVGSGSAVRVDGGVRGAVEWQHRLR